jgi:hypothetical protein
MKYPSIRCNCCGNEVRIGPVVIIISHENACEQILLAALWQKQ